MSFGYCEKCNFNHPFPEQCEGWPRTHITVHGHKIPPSAYAQLIENLNDAWPSYKSAAAAWREPGIPYHELLSGHPEPEKRQGIKTVYVAGPYRGPTREAVAQNVAAARHVGRLCVQKGWFPVLPTVNTAHFDHDFPELAVDAFWLAGTMELMRRCDAVVLVDGWQHSTGALAEIEEARKLGMKVYLSSGVLPQLERVGA